MCIVYIYDLQMWLRIAQYYPVGHILVTHELGVVLRSEEGSEVSSLFCLTWFVI